MSASFKKKFEDELKFKLLQKSNNKLTEEACLIKMFKYFDINDRGFVTFNEFQRAMEKIGLYYEASDLKPLFTVYDLDKSGTLDYKEFSAIVFGPENMKGQMVKKQPANQQQVKMLVDAFRKKIIQRGAKGIIGLQRVFKIMDDDGSKSLSKQEFEKACRDFKLEITSDDISLMFSAFDMNRDGTIQYDEFLRIIRGDLNQSRRGLVERAFKKLDRNENGVIEVEDIIDVYNAKKHPAVAEGRKTEQQVLGEFLETFEQHHCMMNDNQRNQEVTLDEFVEYYTNVSASIDDDMYFMQMMNSAWNLQGDAPQYQKYQKAWANESQGKKPSGYQRKNVDPDGQPTMRSGMISNDNPFGHMSKYYENPSQKQRSIASNKLYEEKERGTYNQITGVESKNNPFHSNINSNYDNHIQTKQKKNEYSKPLGTMAQQKQNQIVIQRFKENIMKRGVKGLIGLKKQFKIMDMDSSGALDFQEFSQALRDYKISCSEEECDQLFHIFDKNNDGTIVFDEFLRALVGDLNEFRINLVKQAFQKLDANGNGTLEISEVKEKFDPSRHPDVKNGVKSVEECRYEFYDLFSTHHNVAQNFTPDREVPLQEFLEYHTFVSSSIDNDNSFKLFMTGVWNLDLQDTYSGVIKPAGVTPQVYGKNSKEQWKYDMHRSLFGQLDDTPMKHEGQMIQKKAQRQQVNSGMQAAGQGQQFQFQQQQPKQQHQQQQYQQRNYLEEVRQKIISRGARGINGIKRVFKIMDDNESKTLDIDEFKKAMKDYRINIEEDQIQQVFNQFDRDRNGEINYDEFLRAIVGDMNQKRKNVVILAFKKFDKDGNGFINIEDLKGRYNAKNHPDVKSGKKTEEDVLYEFLDTFEQHYALSNPESRDRNIKLEEFVEYYNNISCSMDNDEYFELMIRNSWNLDNKNYQKGWQGEF